MEVSRHYEGLVCHHFFNSYVSCTQEQLLGFALLRVCQMCFTQHQESVNVVYSLLRFFAVQLIGSCDTVLLVLELTLAISISPTSTTLMTQSFLLMIQRNGTMFFESLRHQQALWVSTQTGIKTKIQNIGTEDAPRTVHIDNQAVETVSKFTYLGSDIDSEGNSYPEIHRRLGIAGSIMAQLDNI